MSDQESIDMDAAREMAHGDCTIQMTQMEFENMDNELFWTKDDLKKAGWAANRLRREKAKKQIQIQALQQDLLDIENALAVHQDNQTARSKGLEKGNKKRQGRAAVLTAEIVVYLTPLRKEGFGPKAVMGDAMVAFDCGETAFWRAWGLTPKK